MDYSLTPEEFGLVRMGRKRSIIRIFTAPSVLGSATVLSLVGEQTRQVEITRFSLTHIANLTQEDAVKAGFLYLHQLTTQLMGTSASLTEDTPVSIFEFRCEGDPV